MTTTETALPAPETAAVIDRMYAALAHGDITAARACCTPDLVVWHSFDQVVQGLDETVAGWEQLVANYAERSFVDVRRAPVPGGWVQRYLMVGGTASGARVAWPVCLFVTLRDGLIARIDEYIDRAGRFQPVGEELSTPGLPPRRTGRVL